MRCGASAACHRWRTLPWRRPAHRASIRPYRSPEEGSPMIRTVLVVDDSQVDRTHLEKLLASAGYTVTCAATGVEGIEKARNGRPDAILMDINMPEMDGFAATRALRGDASTKDIPVVFVTAKQQ